MNAIEYARDYIGSGWQVVPVTKPCGGTCAKARRGEECSCGKRPIDDQWPLLKIDAAGAARHFDADSNVGVVLGDESGGLVDIDLDCPETVELAPELLPPSREFGRESSRRSHRLYYARHARTERFQQPLGNGKHKVLVELRANKTGKGGEGLQTVFPGSIHKSGELVEWEDLSVEIAEVPPEQLRTSVARLAAAALLMRIGWGKGSAIGFAREPHAGLLHQVPDQAYACISRWLGLPPRTPAQQPTRTAAPPQRAPSSGPDNRLKRAAAYLQRVPGATSGAGGHQQTWAAALAVVRGFELSEAEGYDLLASDYNRRCDPPWSERELRHKVVSALNDGRLEWGYLLKQERPGRAADRPKSDSSPRNDSDEGAREPAAPIAPAEWEPPVEFGVYDLPPFPIDSLPRPIADFVRACAEATQTPPDLAGLLALAACASAVAKRAVVEVKPGYREPLNIFTAIVLPPGERKSAVVREVTAPLIEWEAKAADACRGEIARAAQRYAVSQKRLDAVASTAARARNKEERRQAELELEELAEEHAKLKVPVEPRILADDATPEALGSLLSAHGGRIAIFSAEGGIFKMMGGGYSDVPKLDVYLKAHAGDEIRVDRKNRPAERVTDPALTLGLAVQPAVLDAIAEDKMLRGTGLLARFLYALPTSMIGSRNVDACPIPDSIRVGYETALRCLLVMQEAPRPVVLKLSGPAFARWREFSQWLEPQLAEFAELDSIRDWASKLAGVVARIAGVLGVLGVLALKTHSEDSSISIYESEMVQAIALGRYLVPHALAAFSSMGADPKLQGAKQLLKTIGRKAWTSFSRRELQQLVKRAERFNDATHLDQALQVLVERGFIRPLPTPSMSERGGRPAGPSYEVNPHFFPQCPRNPQNRGSSGGTPIRERIPGEDDE